jgi:hypothetical protein
MKLYIIYGYSYDESYIVYVSQSKEVTLKLAESLTMMARQKERVYRPANFCVLEVESDKLYYPGLENIKEQATFIWDEHKDMKDV